MLEHWALDPQVTYLNHGTVGAPPRRVLAKQQALREEMERQPSKFMLRELTGEMPAPWRSTTRIREASDQVARFFGVRGEDLVFVPNVTTGLNAVIRSVPLGPDDEVVLTDLAYGGTTLATKAIAQERGAAVRTVELPHPVRDPGEVVDAVLRAFTARTKLLVVDHVTAGTALVFPVTTIAAKAHERGIPVAVDGAHAPGSVALDIPSLGVDWYSGNLHKWAHAPRSCGILWAAPERQAALRNPISSWGSGGGFRQEFERVATTDPTPYLAAPAGLDLLTEWGFESVLAYMHDLAWEAAGILTKRWGTQVATPRSMVGAMVTVPLPERAGSTDGDASRLRLTLLLEDHIEVQLHAWKGRLWARVSAQVYNEQADVTALADAVHRRL